MVNPVIVDDRDPRIQYAGVWEESGTSSELNGTTHGVRGLEDKVVGNATFTFTGTSVAIFGTIAVADFRPSASVATISVDGSDPLTFVPQKPSGTLFKQQFYQSSNLNDGEHTLFITISAFNSAMWIDYLQYTPPSSLTPTITQSSATSNTPTVQASQTTKESTQLPHIDTISLPLSARLTDPGVPKEPTWTPSEHLLISSPTIAGSNQLPQGVIFGAASGGPFVFLALLFLLYRRWNKPTEHGLLCRSSPWWNFWSRRAPSPSSIITPFTLSTGSAVPLELPASSSNNHHGNYATGSGYVAQGSTSSEKTGLHLHNISQPNFMSPHDQISNYDSDIGSSQFQDLTVPSPVYHKLDSCTDFLPSLPPTAPPWSQSYVADSFYDWPIDDSPPSYYPRILTNHSHG